MNHWRLNIIRGKKSDTCVKAVRVRDQKGRKSCVGRVRSRMKTWEGDKFWVGRQKRKKYLLGWRMLFIP